MADNNYNYPTMTLNEVCDALRANQVSIGEQTVADLICAGQLTEFARGLPADNGHQRRMLISREGFYTWLEDFLRRPVIRV